MKEIKFRFWDTHNKEFITWPENVYIAGNGKIYTYANIEADLEEKLIPMQYTGLKDKNGKEIYEGDIIDNGHFKTQVYWNEHTCSWSHKSTNVDDALYIYIASNTTFDQELLFEIIGNIYENPELIKESK